MDVARYVAIGQRWWWLLVLGAMFSAATYGVVTLLHLNSPAPPTYTASTTLFATLPPPPEADLSADPSKRPWELDRLIATYAQMAKSRSVAERAVRDADLAISADDLVSRVSTDTFGYTQLLRITATGTSPAEAMGFTAAVVRAFGEVRGERGIPGDAVVYESASAVRTDSPTPELVNVAIVVFAGLVSAAGLVLVFEYVRGGVIDSAGVASGETQVEVGVRRALSGNERA